jgi:hypothetical protein
VSSPSCNFEQVKNQSGGTGFSYAMSCASPVAVSAADVGSIQGMVSWQYGIAQDWYGDNQWLGDPNTSGGAVDCGGSTVVEQQSMLFADSYHWQATGCVAAVSSFTETGGFPTSIDTCTNQVAAAAAVSCVSGTAYPLTDQPASGVSNTVALPAYPDGFANPAVTPTASCSWWDAVCGVSADLSSAFGAIGSALSSLASAVSAVAGDVVSGLATLAQTLFIPSGTAMGELETMMNGFKTRAPFSVIVELYTAIPDALNSLSAGMASPNADTCMNYAPGQATAPTAVTTTATWQSSGGVCLSAAMANVTSNTAFVGVRVGILALFGIGLLYGLWRTLGRLVDK